MKTLCQGSKLTRNAGADLASNSDSDVDSRSTEAGFMQ